MLTVISPAKTLDYREPVMQFKYTQPEHIEAASELIQEARKLSKNQIASLMGVSEKIAVLNHERFKEWSAPFSIPSAKQAIFAFRGDVYTGFDADSLPADAIDFSQNHLRILSGLYGVLRPLDLMQPYRLEMGLKFSNSGGKDLYAFWDDRITKSLNAALRKSGSMILINLASNEYFNAVNEEALKAEIVTPIFKDLRGDSYKVISFFAKKARGEMARYIASKKINEPKKLRRFSIGGYRFSAAESSDSEMYFFRDHPTSK